VHCIAIVGVKGYVLHMKDWNSKCHRAGGGVLLAIKNEYSSEYVPELDTDCELVLVKMYVDWE
jgi:hypothetical protein